MRNTVQILSIKQSQITFKVKKRYNILTPICASFVLLFICIFSFGGQAVQSVSGNMYYIYNPVNSLYSDNSDIVFASVQNILKEHLNFTLPLPSSEIEVDSSGTIHILVDKTIMVKATESGVVNEIGTSIDGVKYIKILHSPTITSVIENVEVVGVKEGDIVKSGEDVATARNGSKVSLKIYENTEQITTIKINQSKIIWEK